ncbi:MAG: hypothetical protein ACRDJ5_06690 [Actinomycetota bacterium]
MRVYDIALFIHLLGVVTLFVALGIMQRGGARVRRAETSEHVRLWLGLLQTTPNMFPGAFAMILIAGLYMTVEVWTFTTSWVVVALVGVAVMVAVGVGVIGRGLNRMGAGVADVGEGSLPAEVRELIADRATWVSVFALNGLALGILLLMATKPGWTQAIAVPIAFAAAGGTVGTAVIRREKA